MQYQRRDAVYYKQHRQWSEPQHQIVTIKKLCDGLGISIVDFFNHSLFFELEQEIC